MSLSQVTEKDFKEKVLNNEKPVLVKFTADWCGPCRAVAPILSELADETPSVDFVELDVDANPVLASHYKVAGIPTMVIFEKGEEVKRTTGAQPKAVLKTFLS